MSAPVKEKKPFLPQRRSAGGSVGAGVGTAVAPSGARGAGGVASVAVGGEPRVHLLPTEVTDRKKLKLVKRRVATAVVGAILVCGIAGGVATVSLSASQTALQTAQTQTKQLIAQQGKYGQVLKVKSDIAGVQQAQKTGTAQEILWQPFLLAVQNTLPAEGSIVGITAGIDSPFSAVPAAPPAPLSGPHIATVNMTVSMNQTSIPAWLKALPKLTGVVDVVPDSVTSTASGPYSVVVTIHLNTLALKNRFTTKVGGTN